MKRNILLFLFVVLYTTHFAQHNSKTDGTLFVRFNENQLVILQDNRLFIDAELVFAELQSEGTWRKTYFIADDRMDSLRLVAEKRLNKKLPNLNYDYRFIANPNSDVEKILAELKSSKFIQTVKRAPKHAEAAAPNYFPNQGYIFDGSSGINAEAVWNTYNNRGAGVKICDIEYTFNPDHLDLPPVTIVGPTPQNPFNNPGDHGTAVLGQIGSLNDGIGTTGIAYESEFYFAGAYYDDSYELENALIETINHLGENDIVLIEQQIYGPLYDFEGTAQFGLVPVEWIKEYYDAIQLVVGQGIIVVEAAGNGEQNLDDPIYSEFNDGHYPFLAGNGSGAIIVGAGAVGTNDVARSTCWFSNHGSAVDIQGNGESIYTTGYGNLYNNSFNEQYTATFGGTSGASPIVTGAIALFISTYFQETGTYLSRDEIVSILQITGKPQVDGNNFTISEAPIGPLPDIKAAIDYAILLAENREMNLDRVGIFPNPSTGELFVEIPSSKIDQITMVDLTGKEIAISIIPHGSKTSKVSTEQLAKGMYVLKIQSAGKSYSERVCIR